MKFWILTAVWSFGLLGFWTLFGYSIQRLPLRWTPRLVALYRLKQFVRAGKQVRVVCFGNPEAGEDAGFLFVFDAMLCGKLCLETLVFSGITPVGAVRAMPEHQGRTAEAYCYHQGRGLQLTGTLWQDGTRVRLMVQKIELSGRVKEIDIRT